MRRKELKKAAIRVFAERGYHAAKVSEIVASAGVAQGTFYLYFESKQALFGEILDDFLGMVTEAVSRWNLEELDSLAQLRNDLRSIGMALARVMHENAQLTRIFFNEALAVDPEFNAQIARFYQQLMRLIEAVNQVCHRNEIYRPIDFEVLAHCVVGMIERVVFQYIVNGDKRMDEAQAIVHAMIDLVLFGAVATHPALKEATAAEQGDADA
jgi:AcrR family transcriptional regulator